MAGSTGIEWCDATFNPWWGCERVSPACAHCYADTLSTRYGHHLWGAGHDFRFFSDGHWAEPLKWARTLPEKLGRRPRVFCASMADVFEERAELHRDRHRLFDLIARTPELDWLILTKRPVFARDWLAGHVAGDPRLDALYPNVWMGVSIENARFTWRADVLREIPAAVRFISAEPLLGSLVDVPRPREIPATLQTNAELEDGVDDFVIGPRKPLDLAGIDWLIIGGESGPKSRRTDPAWIGELVESCSRDGAAPFVKQLGAVLARELGCSNRKGGDIDEWPDELRVRHFPHSAVLTT